VAVSERLLLAENLIAFVAWGAAALLALALASTL
jgi:hypothetical protein